VQSYDTEQQKKTNTKKTQKHSTDKYFHDTQMSTALADSVNTHVFEHTVHYDVREQRISVDHFNNNHLNGLE